MIIKSEFLGNICQIKFFIIMFIDVIFDLSNNRV